MKTFVIGDVHGRRAQLERLVAMLPRDPRRDRLVLLGDLVDRGEDSAGVVSLCCAWAAESPKCFVVLRGNHEQMLLDFLDYQSDLWLHEGVGSRPTLDSYGIPAEKIEACYGADADEESLDALRIELLSRIPAAHLELLRRAALYDEDEHAIYVHAGLQRGRHPRDTPADRLLWARDQDFFLHYTDKPCIFGHTPAPFLPLRGRLGRHGIYIFHSAVGIDSGYTHDLPLSCLELPGFVLRQTFADGRAATHHIKALIPSALRHMHEREEREENLDDSTAAST